MLASRELSTFSAHVYGCTQHTAINYTPCTISATTYRHALVLNCRSLFSSFRSGFAYLDCLLVWSQQATVLEAVCWNIISELARVFVLISNLGAVSFAGDEPSWRLTYKVVFTIQCPATMFVFRYAEAKKVISMYQSTSARQFVDCCATTFVTTRTLKDVKNKHCILSTRVP